MSQVERTFFDHQAGRGGRWTRGEILSMLEQAGFRIIGNAHGQAEPGASGRILRPSIGKARFS